MTLISYPSLVPNMPDAVYHARPELSSTGVKNLNKSPGHCKWYQENGLAANAAMQKGTAFHLLLLEPHLLDERVLNSGVESGALKAHKDLAKDNPDKIVLTSSKYGELFQMRDNLMASEAGPWLLEEGQPEAAMFWQEGDIACRGKADFWRDKGLLIDIKTTADASEGAFRRRLAESGNYLQAAFYRRAYKAITGQLPLFVFIVVETAPPYQCAFYVLSPEDATFADQRLEELLALYRQCLETNHWPTYSPILTTIQLPNYIKGNQ